MIRNRYEHPSMLGANVYYYRDRVRKDDLTYTGLTTELGNITYFYPTAEQMGMVHVMHMTGVWERMDTIQQVLSRDGWLAQTIANPNGRNVWIREGQSVTIDRMAVYTPDDWQRVLAMWEQGLLDGPWFDGSLRPA